MVDAPVATLACRTCNPIRHYGRSGQRESARAGSISARALPSSSLAAMPLSEAQPLLIKRTIPGDDELFHDGEAGERIPHFLDGHGFYVGYLIFG